MSRSFFERIHKAGSSRNVRNATVNSDGPQRRRPATSTSNHQSNGDSSSVGTFEFDNMGVVRDSSRTSRRRGRKSSADERDLSTAGPQTSKQEGNVQAGLRERDSLLDDNGEPLLPADDSSDCDKSGLDRSDRWFNTSHRTGESSLSSGLTNLLPTRTIALAVLIGTTGVVASTLFLGFGIENSVEDQENLFRIRADRLNTDFSRAWDEYMVAALWAYQACTMQMGVTRESFSQIYQYAKSHVDIHALEWIPRVLDEEREALEQESLQFFQMNYPEEVDYQGIMGIVFQNPGDQTYLSNATLQPRPRHDFYYPVHYIEPINENNIPAIELDILSSDLHAIALQHALETWEPAATPAYRRSPMRSDLIDDQFVQLLHPGIPLADNPDLVPRDVTALVIRITALMEAVQEFIPEALSVYIYDSTEAGVEPDFIMAAELYTEVQEESGQKIVYLDEEISLSELVDETVVFLDVSEVQIASRTWTLATVALQDTYEPELQFVILAGKFILIASLCVSLWMITNFRRTKTIMHVKQKADWEKTQVVIRSAREKAKSEQELNDYIAHEIRNPLAAAMSACTFVKSAINEENPLRDSASLKVIREDVDIVDSSLTFTHDLLRSMLDMHRAANNNLLLDETPLDVNRDILEPVVSMLYKRNVGFDILTECPDGMYIVSDRLRLKQILLNLCRNSARYVEKGYIKLGTEVVEGNLQFIVEDTGYGISAARRKNLFSKFQESLEVMDQGSGVGLCLCKSMALLLNGDIYLDEDFDSGIAGFPGTRFIIDLKKAPMSEKEVKQMLEFMADPSGRATLSTQEETASCSGCLGISDHSKATNTNPSERRCSSVEFAKTPADGVGTSTSLPTTSESQLDGIPDLPDLPEKLSVLFVDDDMILRKLFMRSVKKVIGSWDVKEAASGEAAIKLTDTHDFDLIFMDQYMASVEKKLLGTETVRALRSKGVRSRICGLSANDVEDGFLGNGADAFMFKPFPCKKEELRLALQRVLTCVRHPQLAQRMSDDDGDMDGNDYDIPLSGEERVDTPTTETGEEESKELQLNTQTSTENSG